MDRGRERAYTAFVVENGAALAGLSGALAGDRDDAQDLLSEALVAIWKNWGKVVAADRPVAYARRVVVATHLRLGRSRTAQLRIRKRLSALPVPESGGETFRQVDNADLINRCLDELPASQRAAVVLRHYLDLTSEDIARELNCSPAAARTHLSRGHAKLAAVLAQEAAR
ncbi:sigma-70 family RNA polymerase sigma factor [Nakamurella alba]|nr:sigma-70 family RNA polymerase sigma factor [Nakamurella alba]